MRTCKRWPDRNHVYEFVLIAIIQLYYSSKEYFQEKKNKKKRTFFVFFSHNKLVFYWNICRCDLVDNIESELRRQLIHIQSIQKLFMDKPRFSNSFLRQVPTIALNSQLKYIEIISEYLLTTRRSMKWNENVWN